MKFQALEGLRFQALLRRVEISIQTNAKQTNRTNLYQTKVGNYTAYIKTLQFTCRRFCSYRDVLWCYSSYNGSIHWAYQWVPHQPSCHSWPSGWPKNWSDQSHSLHCVSVHRCRNWHRTPFGKFNVRLLKYKVSPYAPF